MAACFIIGPDIVLLYHIIRQNEQLSKYGDTKSARNIMLIELKKLIEANPLFRDKLAFPVFKSSRLRTLINQRLLSHVLFNLFCASLLSTLFYTRDSGYATRCLIIL